MSLLVCSRDDIAGLVKKQDFFFFFEIGVVYCTEKLLIDAARTPSPCLQITYT